MRYLVTGGGGFIGSHIVEYLVKLGEDVRVLDNFSTGRRENIFNLPIELVEGDIRNADTVRKAVEHVDIVFHQAALCSVARSIKDPVATQQTNAGSTVALLEACRRAGVRRVVCASSSSVYGESAILPKHEDMTPNPISPYALSKWECEKYCRIFHEIYGLETVCLRYFNVFGPRQNPYSEYAAVLPRFIQAALNGNRPTVYGNGMQSRDFTYVENVVRANMGAANSRYVAGKVFNVACGERRTLLDIIGMLEEIVHRDLSPVFDDPRPGDIKHSQASIELAERTFGFSPCTGFEEGLRRTVDWFQNGQYVHAHSVA